MPERSKNQYTQEKRCQGETEMSNTLDLQQVAAELGPVFAEAAAERDENDRFVAENYELLKQRRVFSALVPTEFGGGNVKYADMCAFLRALAHHCASTALAVSMHQHLVAAAVANHKGGRPGQKLLERVAADEAVLVSTGANDWLESSGAVQRVDGGFRVSAKKPFGSGSPMGSLLVTSAPYQDPKEGWQVLHFPVPLTAQGVSLADDWRTLGMRATGSQTVVLKDVFVPEQAVVLRRPRGPYHGAFNVIVAVAMPMVMSVYVGVAEAAAAIAREQAAKRAGDPALPYLLGELINLLTTAQLAVDDMVRISDEYRFELSVDTADRILVRKTIAAKSVMAAAEKALEVAGGAGFYRKLGLERLLRDAHGAQFHPLPEKRQQQFTGRVALGLDPIGTPLELVRATAE
jgi:alkylation response protein AidB-like acyl-CoA dehydrogenase